MNQPYEPTEPIGEIDLLAYADGSLKNDPLRMAEVEHYLQDNPDANARVAAFRAQDAEIRRLYDPVLDEPIPERLRAALDPVSRQWLPGLMRGAVAATVLVVTGMSGWYVGKMSTDQPIWQRDSVVLSTISNYQDGLGASSLGAAQNMGISSAALQASGVNGSANASGNTGAAKDLSSTSWLSEHVALQMRLPDLSQQGFKMVGNQTIETDNGNAVRVRYSNGNGQNIVLMLHPRWRSGASDIEIEQQQGISVASWADGPLAYGLASDGGTQVVFDLARRIRAAMREPQTTEPALSSDHNGFTGGQSSERAMPDILVPDTVMSPQVSPNLPMTEQPVGTVVDPEGPVGGNPSIYQ
ncbi:hypothetical protein LPB41_28000 [Thalassospira sp. MA62]|nr:hypothetical protein [Thalassospira sp. MA62]